MWLPWRRRRPNKQPPARPGGPAVHGPDSAYYQYFSGDFSIVSKNGYLILTATHLVFDGRVGADVVVPLQDMTVAEDQPIRRRHLYGHDSQLIIETEAGKIGFLTDDPAGWAAAITAARHR
jgi:hypothetical protein